MHKCFFNVHVVVIFNILFNFQFLKVLIERCAFEHVTLIIKVFENSRWCVIRFVHIGSCVVIYRMIVY